MCWRALMVATLAAATSAGFLPAAAGAAGATQLRAGYLATTNPKQAVSVTVVVPDLRCAKNGRRAVAVGAFGTLTETYKHKKSTHAWAAIVRTVCADGAKSSKAIFTNHVNASASMHVRPGDRVKVVADRAQYWSMTDLTTVAGQAGSGPVLPGQHITASPRVLFGAQLSTPTLPRSPLAVLRAHNGPNSLSALHPVARAARQGNRVVASPTDIRSKTGGFFIKHG